MTPKNSVDFIHYHRYKFSGKNTNTLSGLIISPSLIKLRLKTLHGLPRESQDSVPSGTSTSSSDSPVPVP